MDNNNIRENEASLIGACLRDPSVFADYADIVKSTDFDWQSYGIVWEAMQAIHENGMKIDQVVVGDQLARVEKMHEVQLHDTKMFTGRGALSFLRDKGDPRAAESYARNVLDYSAKKQLEGMFTTGVQWSRNGRAANDIITDIQRQLDHLKTFDGKAASHTQTLAEAVSDAYDHTGAAADGRMVSIPTGYKDLDKLLGGGMSGGDLLIVAARPGQGKTAFLASVAKNASEKKKKVAIFSLEMMNKQIAMRMIAMESGISYDKQKSGTLEARDWPVYTAAIETLASKDYNVFLNDMPRISISRMRQELRRIKGADLILMDYIQLGGVDKKHDRRDLEIGEISAGLKTLAKEFDAPVLAAAQLSRAVEQRTTKRPVLSDLRESGSLENDADVVMFIYRPDQYEKDTTKHNIAEIIAAKHRNGSVGSVELVYIPNKTRFETAATRTFRPNEERLGTE